MRAAGPRQTVVDILGALHVGVADEAGRTAAGLGVAQRLALRVGAAGVLSRTGVDAGASVAFFVGFTVGVDRALDALALHLGVAL